MATSPAAPARSPDLLAAAQALTGIAALVLGLTYAIGASLRAGELREAGVDVREGMAVIPIEQLLTRGIDALVDPRNVLLFFGLVILGLLAAATGAGRRARIQGIRSRIEHDYERSGDELREEARTNPTQAPLLQANLDLLEQSKQAHLAKLEAWSEHAPRVTETAFAILTGVLLIVGVVVFVPAAFGIAVIGGVLVFGLLAFLASRGGRAPTAPTLFAGLLVVVAAAIMIEGQVNPREAVPVEIALKADAPEIATPFAANVPKLISGRLVAVTDDAWYVSSLERTDADEMLTIARDDVEAAVTGSINRESDSVWEAVF